MRTASARTDGLKLMRRDTVAHLLAGGILAALYSVRAVTGAVSGISHAQGVPAAAAGDYTVAVRFLDRSSDGFNRAESRWLAGEVRVGIADQLLAQPRPEEGVEAVLATASRNYLEAATLSPSSAWPWAGLALVYDRSEHAARKRRTVDLQSLGSNVWARIGRAGRVAVGLTRRAIGVEPNILNYRDQLFWILHGLGLREEAEEALRASARVQPAFDAHERFDTLPPELLAVFAQASREVLGRTPFLGRRAHLLDLGKLERRLGRLDLAGSYLRAALEERGDLIQRAEIAFHLAGVLIERKDFEGAKRALDLAEQHEVFRLDVVYTRIAIAESQGRLGEALGWVREARRLEPENLSHCLHYSRIARRLNDFKGAEEALSWAVLRHPQDPSPRVALVETCLEAGDPASADAALRDLERLTGETPEVERLRQAVGIGWSRKGGEARSSTIH